MAGPQDRHHPFVESSCVRIRLAGRLLRQRFAVARDQSRAERAEDGDGGSFIPGAGLGA